MHEPGLLPRTTMAPTAAFTRGEAAEVSQIYRIVTPGRKEMLGILKKMARSSAGTSSHLLSVGGVAHYNYWLLLSGTLRLGQTLHPVACALGWVISNDLPPRLVYAFALENLAPFPHLPKYLQTKSATSNARYSTLSTYPIHQNLQLPPPAVFLPTEHS